MSIALRDEVEPLGIKVMIVEPESFRTNFRVSHIPSEDRGIDDYAKIKEARQRLAKIHLVKKEILIKQLKSLFQQLKKKIILK